MAYFSANIWSLDKDFIISNLLILKKLCKNLKIWFCVTYQKRVHEKFEHRTHNWESWNTILYYNFHFECYLKNPLINQLRKVIILAACAKYYFDFLTTGLLGKSCTPQQQFLLKFITALSFVSPFTFSPF